VLAAVALPLMAACAGAGSGPPGPDAAQVVGDAIPRPLTDTPGDPARGRAIVASRQTGLCLLCHTGPFPEERFQGNLAPDLAGAGSRWTAGQLRLRLADARRLVPQTIMPSYYRIDGLQRVGPAWQGRPMLSAQQIEDVVAFLATLKQDRHDDQASPRSGHAAP
jgi:sulfur-oxidizing protein SoxX